jgi:hypothetical protein
MSDFIPKAPTQKIGGLGPKSARLQALREKAAKANTSSHKKTAFQRKAT